MSVFECPTFICDSTISDRDGVLKEVGNYSWWDDFRKLLLKMDRETRPYIVVLTGSGYEQNTSFRNKYGLDKSLIANPYVEKYPYLLLLENGAIYLNVLTDEIKNYLIEIDSETLRTLKGEFEKRVKSRLENEVLSDFGLQWSNSYEEQKGKVYHAPKLSMVTFGVPREFADGSPYRKSKEADNFRDSVLKVMKKTAQELHLDYEVI